MRWFPVRVAGSSMAPTLRAGEFLGVRAQAPLRVGSIVVVTIGERHDVKRISRIDGDDVWLEGDNAAASTDSRSYGAMPRSAVVGVVRFRYWPVWRARSFR